MLKHENRCVVGRNFDWTNKYAYVAMNPRGLRRGALTPDKQLLSWESKYGSITFNLALPNQVFLKDAPMGGLNEKGFSASLLWLSQSKYPNPSPSTPSVTSNLWAQYLLDQAKDVEEAIQLALGIDVTLFTFHGEGIKVHLFIHDAQGHSAVLEYLDEQLVIHQIGSSPPVLTNSPYAQSVSSLQFYQHFGGKAPLPCSSSSLARFVRATLFWKLLPAPISSLQTVAMGFNAMGYLIELPGTEWETVWTYVFDLSHTICYWRDVDNPKIRYVRLADCDFSTGTPIRILFVNDTLAGNMARNFKKSHSR